MNSINSNVVAPQQPKKDHKVLKHAVNTALVGGGTAFIAKKARNLGRQYDWANAAKFGASNQSYVGKSAKLHSIISNWAEALFPKGGKISNAIERYTGQGFLTGGAERMISKYKGKLAIFGVAAAAITALLATRVYNAGKINGKD